MYQTLCDSLIGSVLVEFFVIADRMIDFEKMSGLKGKKITYLTDIRNLVTWLIVPSPCTLVDFEDPERSFGHRKLRRNGGRRLRNHRHK